MFRGFRIDVSESVKLNTELNDVCTYRNMKKYEDFCQHYQEVNEELENYIKNGILSASEITSKWFPKVNADVFLSHSHQDEEFVTRFAVWLYSVGIKAFIDSKVWNYCDNLLNEIDKKYCRINGSLYSYEKRNQSTSHVHMILNQALMQMIDNTECFIFIGTINSLNINPKNIAEDNYSTYSSWIYTELSASNLMRQKKPERLKDIILGDVISEGYVPVSKEELRIKYDLELKHLFRLSAADLMHIKTGSFTGKDALDELYRMKKIIS